MKSVLWFPTSWFFLLHFNLISINEPESNCSSGIDACNSVQRARYADRLTSICLLLRYYVIIMFTKSLPTTNYPAISPWCHGSCEKRYNKWKCVQPIQFSVVIVVVGHVHTHVLATNVLVVERQRRFADSIHLLLVFGRWDRAGARACGYVWRFIGFVLVCSANVWARANDI